MDNLTENERLEQGVRLIHEIGRAVFHDTEFARQGWAAVSIVISFDGDEATMDAYLYDEACDYNCTFPSNRDLPALFAELRWMDHKEGSDRWKACLFQAVRNTGKMFAQYEYSNGSRWTVRPSNANELLPRLCPFLNEQLRSQGVVQNDAVRSGT